MNLQRSAAIALATVLASSSLVACGDAADDATTAAATAATITLENGTVRAKADASAEHGNDMTAIFGTLRNHTDHEVTVEGFSTSLGGMVS